MPSERRRPISGPEAKVLLEPRDGSGAMPAADLFGARAGGSAYRRRPHGRPVTDNRPPTGGRPGLIWYRRSDMCSTGRGTHDWQAVQLSGSGARVRRSVAQSNSGAGLGVRSAAGRLLAGLVSTVSINLAARQPRAGKPAAWVCSARCLRPRSIPVAMMKSAGMIAAM